MKRIILLAEDEVMVRNLITSFLQQKGYEVLPVSNGGEALETSRKLPRIIDLFLSDVEMPLMDGVTAYKQMSVQRPDMKVLFISGGTSDENLALDWPFLQKPFELADLGAELARILGPIYLVRSDGRKVILVVDQQQTRRRRTKRILKDSGYAVLTADSVEEAEAISESIAQIDLIISEVVFAGDSGVHLAEHTDASNREISTLLISHFHPDILRNVSGFSQQPEFLSNPFTAEGLLTRVRRLLD